MGSVNKVILVGNLGRDAEMRFTSGGTPVANFSLATTEKFKDSSGNLKENTQWHKIVLWGKTAETLHTYLTKGKSIYVEGSLETREWDDKEGKKQKTTEVKAQKIVLLGGGGGGGDRSGARPPSRERYSGGGGSDAGEAPSDMHVDAPSDDDIPF